MLGRPESDIVSKNHILPKKTRDPGPGQYEDKDVQFKKPTTKFAKDSRKTPGKKNNVPAPDVYRPEMVRTDKGFYRFGKNDRFPYKSSMSPGPGQYELQTMNPGTLKSMLGGPPRNSKVKDNGVPGPGSYHEKGIPRSRSIPGFKIVRPEPKSKAKDDDDDPAKFMQMTELPKYPTHTSISWGIG